MRIAQFAPLWETVPPKTYGGTELVVYILCEELAKRGHEVTLFATGDSKSSANLEAIIEKPMREANINNISCWENMAMAKLISRKDDFDIIHNHMGASFIPFVQTIDVPVLHTLHGAFVYQDDIDFYQKYAKSSYISISHSQRAGAPDLNYVSTVYNGIQVEKYSFNEIPNAKEPYIAFLGRLSEEKGTHLAIKLAKETGHKLVIAGKIGKADKEYYEKHVHHLIDGKQIVYIGELGHDDKVNLLKNALFTVHPVEWPEPFGLVMAESMACGTPVLALNQGSIPEVIKDKTTGFVEDNISSLIKRVKDVKTIDRKACRQHVEENFSAERMADGYLNAYKRVISQHIAAIECSKF
jgi:glycosyltransferase involved in cell wall biosynthesis